MNDPHDNAADDKAMLNRYGPPPKARDRITDASVLTDDDFPLKTKTGRLITRADLDQWALEAERFE